MSIKPIYTVLTAGVIASCFYPTIKNEMVFADETAVFSVDSVQVVSEGPLTTGISAVPDPTDGSDILIVNAAVCIPESEKTAHFETVEYTTRLMTGSKDGTGKAVRVNSIDVSNGYVKAMVNEGGEFTITTEDNKNLLYFDDWGYTGKTYIRIDGDSYVFGGPEGVWTTPLYSTGDSVTGMWEIWNIEVTFEMSIVRGSATGDYDTFKISYTIVNNGSSSSDVGFYKMLDTKINNNDSAEVSANGACNRDEREFTASDMPNFWQMFEESPCQTTDKLTARGTLYGGGAVKPDRLVIGDLSRLSGVTWDYTPSGYYDDSAVSMWWNPVILGNGEKRIVATQFGLGAVETVFDNLTLSLSGECFLSIEDRHLLPNPFQLYAIVRNDSGGEVSDVKVEISLPDSLFIESGESAVKTIGRLENGAFGQVSWLVKANLKSEDEEYTYSVTASSSTSGISDVTADKTVFIPGLHTSEAMLYVAAAEIFIDDDPGVGDGQVMAASDETFGESTEEVTASVDISGLSFGYHTVYVRGKDSDGVWGAAASYQFNHTSLTEYIEIDTNLHEAGSQGKSTVYDIDGGENAGFAVYIKGIEILRCFDIDMEWDGSKAEFKTGFSDAHIPDEKMDINGQTSLLLAGEDNILARDDAALTSIGEVNETGHYKITYARLGGEAVSAEDGLLYFVVFNTASGFTSEDGFTVNVAVKIYDDLGNEKKLAAKQFSIKTADYFEPPADVIVSDVPGDQGHALKLIWTLSPDDTELTHYYIYRSRCQELTEPFDIVSFDSFDGLIKAEENSTIFIASVPRGQNSYTDPFVPLNGVTYYYWIESVAETGSSEKVAADYVTGVKNLPDEFFVYAPYPNPFNPAVTIMYNVPADCRVRLAVYDILGREVAVLKDGFISAGVHQDVWYGREKSGKKAGSGLYLFKFTAGEFTHSGKVILLR